MYISYVILNFMAESLTCFVVTMVTFPLRVYDTLLEDMEMRKEGEVNRETNLAPVRPHFLPIRPHFLPVRPHFLSGFFLCLFRFVFFVFFPHPAWLPLLPNHD